jgi:hypothetical protein
MCCHDALFQPSEKAAERFFDLHLRARSRAANECGNHSANSTHLYELQPGVLTMIGP